MDSAHHSLGWRTRVECMSSERGVGDISDAFFQYRNWPVKHWWRNRRRRTWGPRATQWRWNPLPLLLQVPQSKLCFFSLSFYLRSPSLLSLYCGGRSSLCLPLPKQFVHPSECEIVKEDGCNSRSFRTPSPYPQKNQRNSQKENPPLFPLLSKHSPLPHCKKLSSIMDGVSWMKRNEWTNNPWLFRTVHITSRCLIHEVPARGPINRWMTDS